MKCIRFNIQYRKNLNSKMRTNPHSNELSFHSFWGYRISFPDSGSLDHETRSST